MGVVLLLGFGAAGKAWGDGREWYLTVPVLVSIFYGAVAARRRDRSHGWPADFSVEQREATRRTMRNGPLPPDPLIRTEAIRRVRRWDTENPNRWVGVGVLAASGVLAAVFGLLTSNGWWWISAAAFLAVASWMSVYFRQTKTRLTLLQRSV